jgi:hypothetical protein
MHSIRYKHLLFTVSAIPIGAASGFVCAAVVYSACQLLQWLQHTSVSAEDIGLGWEAVLGVSVYFGASLGAVQLPIAYLIFLRHITDVQVSQVLVCLFIGVLVAGVLLSILGAFFSLFTIEIGFWMAVCYARQKTLALQNMRLQHLI